MLMWRQAWWSALLVGLVGGFFAVEGWAQNGYEILGERKRWHPVTIQVYGPQADEQGDPNPFLDYRFNVEITAPDGTVHVVPGFFAADGDAANTSATSGNVWWAIFTPDQTGTYQFRVSFRQGTQVAISLDPNAGTPIAPDGLAGSFTIGETDKSPPDFRARGVLRYVGTRYFRFDDGTYFLKGGAGSPENFLAYGGFDNTDAKDGRRGLPTGVHEYTPHINDWKPGDPTWKDGLGKGIIGAINYLASEGVNSQYFLTMNVGGDGNDVFPWIDKNVHDRFDVSKLAQWDIVFQHMQRKGILLHVITQETENDDLLDGGELGVTRKLYYRELVARFAYHPALIWNLGEENTNTMAQQKAFAEYIRALDPYDHPIVVHTFPGKWEEVYEPLLGYANLEGASIQSGLLDNGYQLTSTWVTRSAAAGHPWVVMIDESGNPGAGCMPDGSDTNQDECRKGILWANLMAGGGGVEWYFGYNYPHNDLNLEDYRSRDRLWDYTRFARQFFEEHLPFWEMEPVTPRSAGAPSDAYVLVQPDGQGWKRAALYFPTGQGTVRPPEGIYDVYWFDPRNGGALQQTSLRQITGGQSITLEPPGANGQDWAVLLVRSDTGGGVGALEAEPEILDFGTVEVGETVRQTLTLRNVGAGPLTLAALALKGAGSNAFAIAEQPALPMDLPGGQEVGLTLQFTPDAATTYEGTLELMDVTGAVLHTVPLRGRGQESGGEPLAVTALVLVDAATDTDLFVLRPDTVLQEEDLPEAINIRAEVQGSAGSVVFWVNEVQVRTENEAPYTLAGDDRGDYQPWEYDSGIYMIRAVPYTEDGGNGTAGRALSLTFEIRRHTVAAETRKPAEAPLLVIFPHPVQDQGQVRVVLPGPQSVHLALYDMLGRSVRVLYAGHLSGGAHTFPLRTSGLAAGRYLCRLETRDGTYVRTVTVLP